MSDEPFLIKDFFNRDSVGALADAIAAADPAFSHEAFLEAVFDDAWESRELKQRMRHITTVLRSMLPDGYRTALGVLLDAVPHARGLGFPAMVFSDFVEAYGTDDWEASVPALAQFTTLVSAEFAIRPFIDADQERTLEQMLVWAHDQDSDVRRLATEGCRPRLPWGMRLNALVADPAPIIPILDQLRSDPDEAVRRSVANNLNDIAKDHPAIVTEVLARWQQAPDEHLPALTRHALRTLLKRGDPGALDVMGYHPEPEVAVVGLDVAPAVIPIGGSAIMRSTLVSHGDGPQPLMVDYVVHFVKANGLTTPRVFKLKTLTLAPAESVELRRKLSFVQLTTRTHRPGTHRLEVQVNGSVLAGVDFDLTEPQE